ncbi:MAG: carbon starvation CstA family protein [Planctomycetia bacterium]|nr:carbon starvation CstA family protein [Planctomycetia bacterium]
MLLFLFGCVMLVVGYFLYGNIVEAILQPDDRKTPAVKKFDGVDFMILPTWKNMLIQLLNIAGIGPVIGVILGIKFGSIVFLIIPVGNIIGGAVHDFISGMMSMRNQGANLPIIIKRNLGQFSFWILSGFMILLLLLVVAVFVNVPADLLNGMIPDILNKMFPSLNNGMVSSPTIFWIAVGAIGLYYIVATLFPIDQIIGRFYPIFGLILLLGTAAVFVALLWHGNNDPAHFMIETEAFKANMLKDPIIPCLFVTIACGIMSGFHGTQSPIIARTLKSERDAKKVFYGMMVVEGLIGMVWAAAGMAIYNLNTAMMSETPMKVLLNITQYFLGGPMGNITILAVVILAITSGDTAMRCIRLTIAENLHISQSSVINRLAICIPLILIIVALLLWSNKSAESFKILWNYFAWGNQVLAALTLLTGTVWLLRKRRNPLIAVIPGAFMCFVVITYILWTSKAHGGPAGIGLNLKISYMIAAGLTLLLFGWAFYLGSASTESEEEDPSNRIENKNGDWDDLQDLEDSDGECSLNPENRKKWKRFAKLAVLADLKNMEEMDDEELLKRIIGK